MARAKFNMRQSVGIVKSLANKVLGFGFILAQNSKINAFNLWVIISRVF